MKLGVRGPGNPQFESIIAYIKSISSGQLVQPTGTLDSVWTWTGAESSHAILEVSSADAKSEDC